MRYNYVKVQCPSCRSIIQMKADAVRTEIFFCPVCEEGVISYRPEPLPAYREDARLSLDWQELVPVYSANR